MGIEISSDGESFFDISLNGASHVVRRDPNGGAWLLNDRWLGHGRVHWTDALSRAIRAVGGPEPQPLYSREPAPAPPPPPQPPVGAPPSPPPRKPLPYPVLELAQVLYTGFGPQRAEKVNELELLIWQAVRAIIDDGRRET